ncbi:hypothetical protein [Staphylococcus capitis]|uniref:hypothetical protein n=1 Tax=Staphylococcus capitis TaxID=29388 RepID=UPI000BFC5B0F|nr:hypothetical protein [Staphylococcus capitis]ATN02462.1 hypothetical protein CRN29_04475 [Staphylococcus capitis]
MKDKEYKRAWMGLKEYLLAIYPTVQWNADLGFSAYDTGECDKLKDILTKMDELDGTNDFKNLLSDLERGNDE